MIFRNARLDELFRTPLFEDVEKNTEYQPVDHGDAGSAIANPPEFSNPLPALQMTYEIDGDVISKTISISEGNTIYS